jgi:hypothetical protein
MICVNCVIGCFETAAVCLAAGPAGSFACFILCETLCAVVCISPACFDRTVEVDIMLPNNTVETTNI